MKPFAKRFVVGVVAAALPAVMFGVPAAAPEPGVQSAQLACSDGTDLSLTLDAVAMTQVSDAVTAINLYPAGDPALVCSLNKSDPLASATTSLFASGSNPRQEYVVGGGQVARNDCGLGSRQPFSFSAHVNANTLTEGAEGTFNLTIPASFPSPAPFCQPSHLVAKVDCLSVTGNTALFTAIVTKATGWYETNNPVGTELAVSAVDGIPDMWGAPTTTGPCNFILLPNNNVVQGNIHVSDAP